MLNEEAAETIARHRGDAIVVVTMTTIFTFPEAAEDPLTIRCAPLMGGASSIGLGLALAHPDRNVLVCDGDGSLLMQLGSLATIAGADAPNLCHFVFENRVLYGGGGRLPIANGKHVDFLGMALSSGYASACSFKTSSELDAHLPEIMERPGPVLIRLDVDLPDSPSWSNENPQAELPDWWFVQMADDGRRAARALADAAQSA